MIDTFLNSAKKSIHFSLHESLYLLKRNQLEDIAENHNIKNPKKIKKAELVDRLYFEISKKIGYLFEYNSLVVTTLCKIYTDQEDC